LDVIFGSVGSTIIFIGIFYVADIWLQSPILIPHPWNLVGLVFITPGLALASWCFKVVLALSEQPVLVTWGPWAHVRQPIYLAGILINLGGAMIIGTALLFVELIGRIVLEILGPLIEERKLRKRFPDAYAEYVRRVPSWIPSLRAG
jgi:protein-S-isoprenylcysteine O-methyltransferase Ste14